MSPITEFERELLTEVGEIGPASAADVARGLGWSPVIVRGRLNHAIDKGLAWRDNYQRRTYVYGLTSKGEDVIV